MFLDVTWAAPTLATTRASSWATDRDTVGPTSSVTAAAETTDGETSLAIPGIDSEDAIVLEKLYIYARKLC